jgi:hypothetical protein
MGIAVVILDGCGQLCGDAFPASQGQWPGPESSVPAAADEAWPTEAKLSHRGDRFIRSSSGTRISPVMRQADWQLDGEPRRAGQRPCDWQNARGPSGPPATPTVSSSIKPRHPPAPSHARQQSPRSHCIKYQVALVQRTKRIRTPTGIMQTHGPLPGRRPTGGFPRWRRHNEFAQSCRQMWYCELKCWQVVPSRECLPLLMGIVVFTTVLAAEYASCRASKSGQRLITGFSTGGQYCHRVSVSMA